MEIETNKQFFLYLLSQRNQLTSSYLQTRIIIYLLRLIYYFLSCHNYNFACVIQTDFLFGTDSSSDYQLKAKMILSIYSSSRFPSLIHRHKSSSTQTRGLLKFHSQFSLQISLSTNTSNRIFSISRFLKIVKTFFKLRSFVGTTS